MQIQILQLHQHVCFRRTGIAVTLATQMAPVVAATLNSGSTNKSVACKVKVFTKCCDVPAACLSTGNDLLATVLLANLFMGMCCITTSHPDWIHKTASTHTMAMVLARLPMSSGWCLWQARDASCFHVTKYCKGSDLYQPAPRVRQSASERIGFQGQSRQLQHKNQLRSFISKLCRQCC